MKRIVLIPLLFLSLAVLGQENSYNESEVLFLQEKASKGEYLLQYLCDYGVLNLVKINDLNIKPSIWQGEQDVTISYEIIATQKGNVFVNVPVQILNAPLQKNMYYYLSYYDNSLSGELLSTSFDFESDAPLGSKYEKIKHCFIHPVFPHSGINADYQKWLSQYLPSPEEIRESAKQDSISSIIGIINDVMDEYKTQPLPSRSQWKNPIMGSLSINRNAKGFTGFLQGGQTIIGIQEDESGIWIAEMLDANMKPITAGVLFMSSDALYYKTQSDTIIFRP